MKLKVWVEVVLFILASASGLLVFGDSLLVSFLGVVGAMIVALPLAKYGRLHDRENERSR